MPDTTTPIPEAHTPGPWACHDKAAYGLAITTGNIAAQNIASVQAYVGLTHTQARANARLIAAAPDMLAQLQGWAALMDPASPDYDPAFAPGLDAIRAAIAKAEGR
jgi:hypothetical protein